jgi:hypothetical protein
MRPDDRELHAERVDEVARLSQAEVVADLVGILGPKCVAAIGDVKETRLVQRWIENMAKPQREQALRTALQAARLLHDLVGSDVARAWFIGCNQHFEMQSPISVLRAANASERFTEVLRAAFEFAYR